MSAPLATEFVSRRRASVVATAKEASLLGGVNSHLIARAPHNLLEAAKARTGIASTTDLVEYALAKVALEDDFGAKLNSSSFGSSITPPSPLRS